MREFRFIGQHAEETESNTSLEPGAYTGPIEEGDDFPKTAQLIEDGYLIEVPAGTHEASLKAEEDVAPASDEPAKTEPAQIEQSSGTFSAAGSTYKEDISS